MGYADSGDVPSVPVPSSETKIVFAIAEREAIIAIESDNNFFLIVIPCFWD